VKTLPNNYSPTSKNTDLPALGNGIDYGLIPKEYIEKYNSIRPHIDNLRSNIDAIKRLQSGQVGPELQQLLMGIGPRGLRKAIGDGRLTLDANVLNPYLGFTYRF